MPEPRFVASVTEDSIPMGKYVRQEFENLDLLIIRVPEGVYAIENKCSHMNMPLARGRVRGKDIACPVHGGRFDITNGCAVSFPASRPIKTFPTRVVDGIVEIDLSGNS